MAAWALGSWGAAGCNLESALGVDEGGSQGEPPSTTSDQPVGSTSTQGDPTAGGSSGADGVDSTGQPLPPAACGGRTIRVAAFNIESVGAVGSESYQALLEILQRLDADIVCMEEVEETETTALFALRDAAGYTAAIQASNSPAIGGEVRNACLSRVGLQLIDSYTASDLSPDSSANDVGRDILVVQAELSEPGEAPCRLGLVALHLKSGQDQLDWFRRQVEAIRVGQAVELYREQFPGEPLVIMGDFNENDDDPAIGSTFPELPVGLPDSYRLGSDIQFPLTYDPFATFAGLGFSMVPATQEDSTRTQTWADLVRLDYVMPSDSEAQGAVVYNACRDNGVDDAPAGAWLPLAGDPLDCATSELASDHFPVLVDLWLP